jgi:hypothetical protein
MSEEARGSLRRMHLTIASGAGGDVVLPIRPPEGEVWDVYQIYATHDDVAREIHWRVYDSVLANDATVFQALAATLPRYWNTDVGQTLKPIRLNRATYINFRVQAMAGAKNVTAEVLIERLVGVGTWTSA